MNAKTIKEVLQEEGRLLYKSIGTSMLPLIRQGRDFVYIKKRPEGRLKKYDVVLYQRQIAEETNVYVLHRILKVNRNGTYWIVGDNCTYGETVADENIFGVLSVVKRKGKDVKTTDLCYKIYTHLWCAPYKVRFFARKCRRGLSWVKNKMKRLFAR